MYSMNYTYKFTDNSENQWLTIKISIEGEFNNREFAFDDNEAKEIYELLVSDNEKEIQEFLQECLQEDDVPTMSQLEQNGGI